MIAEWNFPPNYIHRFRNCQCLFCSGRVGCVKGCLMYGNNVTNSMVSQTVSATNGQAQREKHWPSLQEMNDRDLQGQTVRYGQGKRTKDKPEKEKSKC